MNSDEVMEDLVPQQMATPPQISKQLDKWNHQIDGVEKNTFQQGESSQDKKGKRTHQHSIEYQGLFTSNPC